MQATQVGAGNLETAHVGNVNFDANLVPEGEMKAAEVAEATAPQPAAIVSMGTVALGTVVPQGEVVKAVVKPQANIHTIGLSISLTLNTGFTLIKGMKELKTIDIERNGVVEKYNFYNPFLRADKDRHTGEGVLRKTLGAIAGIAHTVLGREAVYIGEDSNIQDTVRCLAENVRQKLSDQFPLAPEDQLFSVEMDIGGQVAERPVTFGELFAVNSWVTSTVDEEDYITTHVVHFNIALNAGAVYDSAEPHTFVRKAETFLESTLRTLGINDTVQFNCNYAFDSATLADSGVRDTLELLIGEDGYSVISKAGVESGKYDWIPSSCANGLFGYGCDLILCSPEPEVEEAAE